MAMMSLITRNKTKGAAIASAMKSVIISRNQTTEAAEASSRAAALKSALARYQATYDAMSPELKELLSPRRPTPTGDEEYMRKSEKIRKEITLDIYRNFDKNYGGFMQHDPATVNLQHLKDHTTDLEELEDLLTNAKAYFYSPSNPYYYNTPIRTSPFSPPPAHCPVRPPSPSTNRGGGLPDISYLNFSRSLDNERGRVLDDNDDPSTVATARLALVQMCQYTDMELEFIRVKKVWEGKNKLDRHMIVQATDCAASRVPITLKVEYSLPNYTIKMVQPYTGGRPFMKVIGYREMMEKGTKVTALLFANPRGCPVINKRLGLTRWDEVVDRLGLDQKDTSSLRSCRRGKLLNVHLDDPTLLCMAEFALSKQNQSSQESCLHLMKNMEAWREMLGINYIEKSMYHIVLEVEDKGGVAKVFYAAVVASPKGKPLHLANWISVGSPRATMNLP